MKIPAALSKVPPLYLAGGGAVLLLLGYVYFRGVQGAAKDATGAIVSAGAGVVEGAVVGVGSVFGVPETDEIACELACAAGNTGQASAKCSAGRFVQYLWNGK